MLVLDDNMLQVPDEIKSSVVNMLCVWEPWRILNSKNLIVPLYICSGLLSKLNPVARRIYPVYAYLIQLLFLKLYFTITYARICLFCVFTFVFFVFLRLDMMRHCIVNHIGEISFLL